MDGSGGNNAERAICSVSLQSEEAVHAFSDEEASLHVSGNAVEARTKAVFWFAFGRMATKLKYGCINHCTEFILLLSLDFLQIP